MLTFDNTSIVFSSTYLAESPAEEPVDGIAEDVIEEDDDLDDGEEDVDDQPTGAHPSFRHSGAAQLLAASSARELFSLL